MNDVPASDAGDPRAPLLALSERQVARLVGLLALAGAAIGAWDMVVQDVIRTPATLVLLLAGGAAGVAAALWRGLIDVRAAGRLMLPAGGIVLLLGMTRVDFAAPSSATALVGAAAFFLAVGYWTLRRPVARWAAAGLCGVVVGVAARDGVLGMHVPALLMLGMTAAIVDASLAVALRLRGDVARERDLAALDPLTGLLNRRGAARRLDDLPAGALVLMIDLDGFKGVNDELGHVAGDRLLTAVGPALAAELRPTDLAVRWGGDEFLVAIPAAADVDVDELAPRLRIAIAQVLRRLTPHGDASIGATRTLRGEPVGDAIARADRALLIAKRTGRARHLYLPGVPHRADEAAAS